MSTLYNILGKILGFLVIAWIIGGFIVWFVISGDIDNNWKFALFSLLCGPLAWIGGIIVFLFKIIAAVIPHSFIHWLEKP